MKKTKILIFALVLSLLVLALSGCMTDFLPFGSDDGDTADNAGNTAEPPTIKSEYTVTFDTAGGTELPSRTVKAGAKCSAPYATIRSGAEFTGWFYNGELWNFNTPVNADITLTAGWKILTYNISYDLGGGSYDGDMPKTYTVETETIALGTPVKENYEFIGWEINGKKVNEIKVGSTGDKTVKALWFGLEAIVMPAKGGASGIVSIIHDDARLPTMAILDEILEKYGLVADVGFLLNKVYSKETVDRTAVENYQSYLDTGRWKMVNHSATHSWWGKEYLDNYGISHATDDEEKRTYEIETSALMMRKLFPDQRVLTFAYPGFSAITNKYTDGSIAQLKQIIYTPAARSLIDTHHIGARYYGGGANKIGDGSIDWNWISTRFLSKSSIENNLDSILESAVKSGNFEVLSIHGLTNDQETNKSDPGYWLMGDVMDLAMSKVNKYVDEGKLWNANFEDAVMYLREAETAKTTIKKEGAKIIVTLTDGMSNDIYDMPLTLRIKNFGNWNAVKIVQGDNIQYTMAETVDGETHLQFDALPDAGDITISPVSISEIPK